MSAAASVQSNLDGAVKQPPVSAKTAVKRVDIILDENDNIPRNGLMIGHNGTQYLLQPGVKASVPEGVLDVLNHAIESKPVINPQTRQVTGHKNGRRYSYRVLRDGDDGEE